LLLAIAVAAIVGGVVGLRKQTTAPPTAPPVPPPPRDPPPPGGGFALSVPPPTTQRPPNIFVGLPASSTRPPPIDPTIALGLGIAQTAAKGLGTAASAATALGAGATSAATLIPPAVAVAGLAIAAIDIFGPGVDGPSALDGMSPAQKALYYSVAGTKDNPKPVTEGGIVMLINAGVMNGDASKLIERNGVDVRVGGMTAAIQRARAAAALEENDEIDPVSHRPLGVERFML
jgi:hypothetical protein